MSKHDVKLSPAFIAGRQAYKDGVVIGDNPHDEDAEDHWQWMAGWADEGIRVRKRRLAAIDV